MDMARQCWDEARHAEIMIRRIEATGVPWQPGEEGFSPYPLDNGPWRDVYPGDLFERLVAMNRGIEGLALDTHLYRSDTFAGLGDDVAAATHLYIVADEAPHVGFGTRWLRYLLFKDTQPRQADLALIPFFPVLGQRFAPGHDAAGQDELQHFKEAETAAWERIAERRAARLSAEGRVDFAAGDGDADARSERPRRAPARCGQPAGAAPRRIHVGRDRRRRRRRRRAGRRRRRLTRD